MTPLHRIAPAYWLLAIVLAFVGGLVVDDVKLDGIHLPGVLKPEPATGPIFGVVVWDAESGGGSPSQDVALESESVAEYLAGHGLKENGTIEWRKWDDDKLTADVLTEESSRLRECYAIAKKDSGGKYPWLVISNGATHGYSGPLPDGKTSQEAADALLAILKKYGG